MRPDLIRVVLVDDHQNVRARLKTVLATAKDIAVVGEAASGTDAIALAERVNPHVIVIALTVPDMSALAVVHEVQKLNATRPPNPDGEVTRRMLVITTNADDEQLPALLKAGTSGHLLTSVADRELVGAVRTVSAGNAYVQPAAARGPVKRDGAAEERTRFAKLTEREQVVLRMVAEGHTAPEIGVQLTISPKTVDTYKQRIGEKLGLTHRTDYVKFALRLGLLKTDA